jgi:hypothetical protein
MKVIALVFDYDLNKVAAIGRRWAKDVYKNKDYIFEYSAACYATFVDKNPVTKLNIFTDDIELLRDKLNKYKINLSNINFHDYNERLKRYVDIDYYFRILFDLIKENHSSTEYTVKIDNDMIFLDSIPDMPDNDNRVMVWKKEHYVDTGNPLWGEKKACQVAIGHTDFYVYNTGLMGLPINIQKDEVEATMNALVKVDISDVTDVGSKIYHCCEQTAWNWIFHKYNYNIIETHSYIKHHFDNKVHCITEAKYLLR